MKRLMGERLNLDWKIAVVTVVSTSLLMVDNYHSLTSHKYYDRVILYLFVPLALTLLVFRENPKEYGFSLGDWKLGLAFTFSGILAMTPVIYYLGRHDAETQKYYADLAQGLPWTTCLDLIGWEFFFRGWILFAYARKFGDEALWLQAVPFALAHIGKPEVETLSTIFGGFAFGWMAYRAKSFIYPFLIHWFIATFIILVASGAIP
jgi:membrane protease YdiL (CAAX protease family)